MSNVITVPQREDQFLQLISQAKFGNLERDGTISAVDNYTGSEYVCVSYMCTYM